MRSAAELISDPNAAALREASIQVGAFAMHDNDAAIILTLPPGSYAVVVSGADSNAGTALLETYTLP